MADKRRKRPMMAATASHYDESREGDFHIVTIGDANSQAAPRRRSASAGRSESWMAKVTTAMSHRIFSGRRLSASRSTQVMPMLHAHEANSNKASDECEHIITPRNRVETLRQVSSEATLTRAAAGIRGDANKLLDSECPTFVCDIDPEASCEESDPPDRQVARSTCSVNTIHVATPTKLRPRGQMTVVEKVHPQFTGTRLEDEETEAFEYPRRRQSADYGEAVRCDSQPLVHDAAPILKDFFSRSAAKTQRERAQLRESRRENHYQNSKQRQDRLREQYDQEQHEHANEQQREKIERLRKLNQQRRLQLRIEAAQFKHLVVATNESDQKRFLTEREQWENGFEDEIRTLGRAYRKASSKIAGDDERPMTVAGLAVPEALTQIQREAVRQNRRIQTAAPAGWSPLESTSTFASLTSRCNVLHVEDSPEVFEVFGDDSVRIDSTVAMNELTIEKLLEERQVMVEKIIKLENQVLAWKQGVVVVESGKKEATERHLEQGFFI